MSSVAAISEPRSTAEPPAEPEHYGLAPEIAVAWLERVVAALEPQGARIWIGGDDGPRPYEEFGGAWSSMELPVEERCRYRALIGAVLRQGTGKIAEPRSVSHDALEGGNPTEFTLLACPISVDGRNVAVVEAWFEELPRSQQDAAAEKLSQLAAALRDALSRRRLDAARRQTEFAARLAGRLEVKDLAREIAAGLCALVRADRVVLCRKLHGTWRIVGAADAEGLVSTVDDERAILREAEIRSRGEMPEIVSGMHAADAGGAADGGEGVAADDAANGTEDGANVGGGDVQAADGGGRVETVSYAEHTDVKTAVFVPLVPRTDTRVRQSEFVLIAEWYRREALDRSLRRLLDDAVPPVERALEAARRCEALPLRRLAFGWARLKLRSPLRGIPILLVAIALPLAAMLATFFVPWNYSLAAPGTLRPAVRHGVFAGTDGVVERILVTAGTEVKRGDVLVRLTNPELAIDAADCRKRLAEAGEELRSAERRYNEDRRMEADVRARLPGQIQVLRRRVEGLRAEQAILAEKMEGLVIASPIDGRVVTWDLERSLAGRPVRRGELLLHVADPAQEWELELRLPQRRYAELTEALAELGPEPAVAWNPTSEPELTLGGRLTRVDRRADVRSAEEGPVVLLAAAADAGGWASRQDGAEVRARIDCGRRSLGYVLFRDAADWCRAAAFHLFPF